MKKNISLTILSFLFFLLLTEIGIRYLIFNKKYLLFKTENHLNFYKKYTNYLHHLRDTTDHPKEPSNYLFNFIKKVIKIIQYYFKETLEQTKLMILNIWIKTFLVITI